MAKYFWDLSATFSDNTDIAGQSTQGSANANTLDTIIQKHLAVLAVFGDYIGGVGTVGGTADAITLTSSATYPTQSLANGNVLAFKAASANTGAATINVDALGVKAIRRQGDSALSANDIAANGIYLIRYDTAYNGAAGAWVLLNREQAPAASDTVAGLIEIAVQSEMEAGSSTTLAVTPGRQHYHPGMAKAWGVVSVSGGTPSLVASHNITSIADGGGGKLDVTIATDFSSANYVIIASVLETSSEESFVTVEAQAAGTFSLSCNTDTGTSSDPDKYYFACFGDQ